MLNDTRDENKIHCQKALCGHKRGYGVYIHGLLLVNLISYLIRLVRDLNFNMEVRFVVIVRAYRKSIGVRVI